MEMAGDFLWRYRQTSSVDRGNKEMEEGIMISVVVLVKEAGCCGEGVFAYWTGRADDKS